jgi:hypothetical protein
MKFKWHGCTFKAGILSGTRPKGDRTYHPKNWTGEVFYLVTHTIRLTSKHAVVEVHEDLGAGSENDLLLKYHSLAETYLGQFSERHKLRLGAVKLYREPHRPIPGSKELAEAILREESEIFCPENGIQIDRSHEEGEIEFVGKKGKETAQAFAFTLNQMPSIAAGLRSEMHELKATVTEKVTALESNLTLLALKQRNMELEEQNREMMNQIKTFSAELSNIKALLGNIPASPEKKQEDKWSRIYG